MQLINSRVAFAVALAVAAAATPYSRAMAQAAALEEIVVTAERRETSLQNTPL